MASNSKSFSSGGRIRSIRQICARAKHARGSHVFQSVSMPYSNRPTTQRRAGFVRIPGHTQGPPRFPSTARAVAFTWRCAASSGARTRCLFLFGRTASIRRLLHCQCAGATIPDKIVDVTGADADQASAAVLTMKMASRVTDRAVASCTIEGSLIDALDQHGLSHAVRFAIRECFHQHRHDLVGSGAFVFRDTVN